MDELQHWRFVSILVDWLILEETVYPWDWVLPREAVNVGTNTEPTDLCCIEWHIYVCTYIMHRTRTCRGGGSVTGVPWGVGSCDLVEQAECETSHPNPAPRYICWSASWSPSMCGQRTGKVRNRIWSVLWLLGRRSIIEPRTHKWELSKTVFCIHTYVALSYRTLRLVSSGHHIRLYVRKYKCKYKYLHARH